LSSALTLSTVMPAISNAQVVVFNFIFNLRQRMGFSQLPLRTLANFMGYMHFYTVFLKNGH